jgi:hypothetical protein
LRLRSLHAARERRSRTVHEILGCAHLFSITPATACSPMKCHRCVNSRMDGEPHIRVVPNRAAELWRYTSASRELSGLLDCTTARAVA